MKRIEGVHDRWGLVVCSSTADSERFRVGFFKQDVCLAASVARMRHGAVTQHEAIAASFLRSNGMLVCSRKVGERLLVGDDIVVTLVRIGPNACRIGIEAPKNLNIVREELVSHPIQCPEPTDEELSLK